MTEKVGPGITGLVLTCNGQRLIDQCLTSLSFCDELLVVDSGSQDQTLEIATGHNIRIVPHAWEGFIGQHKFAQTLVQTPWVVTIDQDEYLSAELQKNILKALANPGDTQGFYCPRRSFYFDRFMRHSGWYPDYLLRVFRKDSVIVGGRPPHEEFTVPGPTAKLSGEIIHHPYVDLAEHLTKLNRYTTTAAEDLYAKGKKSSLALALGHAMAKFIKQYVVRRGFLDGRAGLLLASQAFFYTLNKYMKLLELHLENQKDGRIKTSDH